ncbi:hypothetical protein LEMLEM_LOCUS3708, partial [Lemmus lemmus]
SLGIQAALAEAIISRKELEFADASGQPEGPPLESPGLSKDAAQFLMHCHRKEFHSESKRNKDFVLEEETLSTLC